MVRHANNERVFRLEYVSNNEISDREFQRWREAMIKQVIRKHILILKQKTMLVFRVYPCQVWKILKIK